MARGTPGHPAPGNGGHAVPGWFADALAAPVDTGEVDVVGTPVRYRAWGEPGADGLVLVHGGAAHSRW